MSLPAGTQLAHYEILAPIGKGGMGEVYRARDTKLEREVAIKILPDEFAQDEERLRRFQREAKVLASLNHPGIAAIHGVEESDGTHYLVLELVRGETLAARILSGPIPVDDALPMAIRIAEALEQAHGQGIVHRDLKPANIMLTPDGKVKVLDFGLAKALVDESSDQNLSQSPTLTRDATQSGVILGTAPYMSPEQAKGKPVDHRTDIFSFGAVLYEMLSQKRAFAGEDVSDTLAAVLRANPEWASLPSDTDLRMRALLRGCLQKDKSARRRDMGDVRSELEDVRAHPLEDETAASQPRPTRAWSAVLWVLPAALIAGYLAWTSKPTQTPARTKRFDVQLDATARVGRTGAVLSRDGRQLAYVTERELYLRDLERFEPTRIAENASSPFFSPDGEWLGFWSDGTLQKISTRDGTIVTLGELERPFGASWGDDDSIVLGLSIKGIWQIPGSGGSLTPLITVDSEPGKGVHSPQRLPGTRAVLYSRAEGSGAIIDWESSQIVAESLDSGERHVVVDHGFAARYLPTGHLVYYAEGALLAARFDLETLQLAGDPAPVVEDLARLGSFYPHASLFSASASGDLVYVPEGAEDSLQLVWVDRTGNPTPVTREARAYRRPVFSPDGKRLALHIGDVIGRSDLWIYDIERDSFSRLTNSENNGPPQWSPDGEWLAFQSEREGDADIYRIRTDFSAPAEPLLTKERLQTPQWFTPDGSALIFAEFSDEAQYDLWLLPIGGEGDPRRFFETPFFDYGPVLSPDGRYIAYHSEQSGRQEIYVQSFPEMASRVQVSRDGGNFPMWSRAGGELFFQNRPKMMVVDVKTEPSFEAGIARVLFEGGYVNNQGKDFDVSPDGQRFVMLQPAEGAASENKLRVVLNFFEELERLVPIER